jgi:hypothetical protein
MPATLAPEALDREAARVVRGLTARERQQWAGMVGGYARTAPRSPAARGLLTMTVEELVAEAGVATQPRARDEVRLPGRLIGALPGRLLPARRDITRTPADVLAVAAAVLRDWGWQNKPYKLRNARGARCVCGAIAAAYDMGVGSEHTAHVAAGHVLAVLQRRGWQGLIGEWNRAPGRTKQEAVDLVTTAHAAAAGAGR